MNASDLNREMGGAAIGALERRHIDGLVAAGLDRDDIDLGGSRVRRRPWREDSPRAAPRAVAAGNSPGSSIKQLRTVGLAVGRHRDTEGEREME